MASAFRDRRGWIADFLPYGGAGKTRRRVRVPAKYLHGDEHQAASAFANECDRYCRLLEIAPHDIQAAHHALNLSAITEEQAQALLGYRPVLSLSGPEPLSIMDAACQHPSTIYEQDHSPREYLRHRRELDEFIAFSQLEHVADITLAIVQQYVQWLKSNGYSYHGIRHRLLYVRYALAVGASAGLNNPLAGWRINRAEPSARIDTWTLDELRWLAASLEPRAQAVVYLGGFMGLRSSEITRLTAGDLRGDVLFVGEHGAKNVQSRRALPVPGIILERLESLEQSGDSPLIRRPRRDTPFDAFGLDHYMHPMLEKPPKMLRKAFSSWAVNFLPPRHVETFLGHSSGLVSQVTARHYLADIRLAELRPSADVIHKVLTAA